MTLFFRRFSHALASPEVFKCRQKFDRRVKEVTNWFPGHMNKGLKDMQKKLSAIDCIVEVHDARIAQHGRNPNFHTYLTAVKPHILVLNKVDLSDYGKLGSMHQKRNELKEKLLSHTCEQTKVDRVLFTNCKKAHDNGLAALVPTIIDVVTNSERYHRQEVFDFCVMVIGVPNCGKSSLINHLRNAHMRKGKATSVGAMAGVTRSVMEHIKISLEPNIYVLDTPGILAPNMKHLEIALKLALCGTFQDHLVGVDLMADYLLYCMNKQKRYEYVQFLGLQGPLNDINEALIRGAINMNKMQKMKAVDGSGEYKLRPNINAVAQDLIVAFRSGKFGPFSL